MKLQIGETLKTIRTEQGLSIRDLAAQADISAASLSNLERNLNSPTLDSLSKICNALGIHMIDLLQQNEHEERMITRVHDRTTLTTEGSSQITYELVTPTNKAFKSLYITMAPLCNYGYTAKNFPSDEICFIISGEMEIIVDDVAHILSTGDTIYINAKSDYKYRNLSNVPCVTLWSVHG